MLFAVICTDHPNQLDLRMATRPAHLEYLNQHLAQLRLVGPLIKEGQPQGSLLVIEAGSLAEAEAFAAADPYAKAGLFAEVRVEAYRVVFENGAAVA